MTERSDRERLVLRRMKDDWNERARSNAEFFIASADAVGEEAFRSSGERDVALFFEGIEHLLVPSAVVVDIGCGIGRMDEFVAPRVRRLIGFDVSGEMVAKARARLAHLPNVEFRENDGFSLTGIAAGTVDLIFSHIVFQHVPAEVMEAYFHVAYFALRLGGTFVFQVPEAIGDEPVVPPVENTWDLRFYREEELRSRLAAIGYAWVDAARCRVDTPGGGFNQLRVRVTKAC